MEVRPTRKGEPIDGIQSKQVEDWIYAHLMYHFILNSFLHWLCITCIWGHMFILLSWNACEPYWVTHWTSPLTEVNIYRWYIWYTWARTWTSGRTTKYLNEGRCGCHELRHLDCFYHFSVLFSFDDIINKSQMSGLLCMNCILFNWCWMIF